MKNSTKLSQKSIFYMDFTEKLHRITPVFLQTQKWCSATLEIRKSVGFLESISQYGTFGLTVRAVSQQKKQARTRQLSDIALNIFKKTPVPANHHIFQFSLGNNAGIPLSLYFLLSYKKNKKRI